MNKKELLKSICKWIEENDADLLFVRDVKEINKLFNVRVKQVDYFEITDADDQGYASQIVFEITILSSEGDTEAYLAKESYAGWDHPAEYFMVEPKLALKYEIVSSLNEEE